MAVMQITAMNLTEPPPTDIPIFDNVTIQNSTSDDQFDLWSLTDDISGTAVFWGGGFLPPPPRPLFLVSATEDGPTTCDLCTWAWNNKIIGNIPKVDVAQESTAEFGWFLTLIIVSITSFIVGAFIMITFLHCRSRLKNGDTSENSIQNSSEQSSCGFQRPKTDKKQNFNNPKRSLFSWFTRKSSAKLTTPSSNPAQNHYTHMNSAYSLNDEAAYAELDDGPVVARLNSAYNDDFDENLRNHSQKHAQSERNHAPINKDHAYFDRRHAHNDRGLATLGRSPVYISEKLSNHERNSNYFERNSSQNESDRSHNGEHSLGDISPAFYGRDHSYEGVTDRENPYSAVSEHAYCDADAPSDQYCDADAPSTVYDVNTQSSAPSSAYYSDLSLSAQPDRTYEVIGVNNGFWDYQESLRDGRNVKLGSINEILASDYV